VGRLVAGILIHITCGVHTAKFREVTQYCIGVDDYARAVGGLYLSLRLRGLNNLRA